MRPGWRGQALLAHQTPAIQRAFLASQGHYTGDPIILPMGESGEAPRVERPVTPTPPNADDTECAPIILPMGVSGEAPRVERPVTPSPPNTSNTKWVLII